MIGSVPTNRPRREPQRENGMQAGDGQRWCPRMAAAASMAYGVCWDVGRND